MDPTQSAELAFHTRKAADLAGSQRAEPSQEEKAAAYLEVVEAKFRHSDLGAVRKELAGSKSRLVSGLTKADTPAHTFAGGDFGEENIAILAESWIGSVADLSLLDQSMKYCRVVPRPARRVLMAAGFAGDVVAEGTPKAVRRLSTALSALDATKSVTLIVASDELLALGGDPLRKLIDQELRNGVVAGANNFFVQQLAAAAGVTLPSTGDPLQDLRAGLQAAPASHGYVVAAPTGDVADLATRVENRGGMSVRGGTFVPGVEIVAVEGLSEMLVVPASQLALRDFGISIRNGGHCSVMMSDTPESPAQQVSMFQTNCQALLVEREFNLLTDDVETVVISGS